MLQVARVAPRLLGEAAERVGAFLEETLAPDGAGTDRGGGRDLYYSVFALEGLHALQRPRPVERTAGYLRSFGDGEGLDLVHLACLVRCHASIESAPPAPLRDAMLSRLAGHRSADGGFAGAPGAEEGTLYHAFLAVSAHQDLGAPLEAPERLVASILSRECADGSFTNDALVPVGNVPSTAAALTVLRHLEAPRPARAAAWLRARHVESGGFLAAPAAPIPDLLSTATALHALSGAEATATLDAVREPCLDFLDSLWTGRAFCGNWTDETPDAEYTWYALLALGHLAL